MKFLKKHIKIILIFVVSMLIVSMVSVYATYSYLAQDVSYTKTDGTEVSVKDALDELYKTTEVITYEDSSGKEQKLSAATAVGTKIGSTTVDGQKLDWYLFDVSDDGKTAYLVSTPTYWVPDTTKEVRGAWVPKLVSMIDYDTHAMQQAIQKLDNKIVGYSSSSVKYKPSDNTLKYYKRVNQKWSEQRGSFAFASLNENEQEACYLADEDIFKGIKDQVNESDGNLKGKIQTLVGGASVEQWCKAYNKQTYVTDIQKISCEYSNAGTNGASSPGYGYKVGESDLMTYTYNIIGNDIYGAARTNNHLDESKYPFFSWWYLASPADGSSNLVCYVSGDSSGLAYGGVRDYGSKLSLFASVLL